MKDDQNHLKDDLKIKLKGVKNIQITGEYIKLDAVLKFASIVSSGGEAKIFIRDGEVFVNGKPCLQRGKKIRDGDIVRFRNDVIRICI